MADTTLVPTLKRQHASLVESLTAFSRKAPTCAEIQRFAGALTAHLELEDGKLYPALEEAGAISRAVASGFQGTMKALARDAIAFIEKWSKTEPATDETAFQEELGIVTQKLGERIQKEEEKLYPLVEKL